MIEYVHRLAAKQLAAVQSLRRYQKMKYATDNALRKLENFRLYDILRRQVAGGQRTNGNLLRIGTERRVHSRYNRHRVARLSAH